MSRILLSQNLFDAAIRIDSHGSVAVPTVAVVRFGKSQVLKFPFTGRDLDRDSSILASMPAESF